jgi:hypothetical protein
MARKLERLQPSSSIANVLDLDAACAAIGKPSRHQLVVTAAAPLLEAVTSGEDSSLARFPAGAAQVPPSVTPSAAPTGEFPQVMRQIKLTPTADATLQSVIEAYSRATGLELTRSEFMRALILALGHTRQLHEREARGIGRLRRPKNEARLFHKRDELERSIARAFIAAMRGAATME